MKAMLAQFWLSMGAMFQAWQSFMNMILNLTQSGEVMTQGVLNGVKHDAEVDSLKLEEEIAVFKQQSLVRKQALLAAP